MPNSLPPKLQSPVPSSARAANVVIDGFPKGHRLALSRVDTATLTSMVTDYVRDRSVCGELHCEDLHYFDFTVSGRPKGSWGRFPDTFSDLERVGKVPPQAGRRTVA